MQVLPCRLLYFARAEASKGEDEAARKVTHRRHLRSYKEQAGPLKRCVTRAKTPLGVALDAEARRVSHGERWLFNSQPDTSFDRASEHVDTLSTRGRQKASAENTPAGRKKQRTDEKPSFDQSSFRAGCWAFVAFKIARALSFAFLHRCLYASQAHEHDNTPQKAEWPFGFRTDYKSHIVTCH